MPRPPRITRELLTSLIRSRGPVSATELADLLRANRSTITRVLSGWGDELVTLGATRSTRYLLRRSVRGIGDCWPIYRIDEAGRAHQWAELEALHDRNWRMKWHGEAPAWSQLFTEENGLWQGFPFFLEDIRPQGFLGRIIAGGIARTLRVPEDPRQWRDEDNLTYLQEMGDDLPGNVVIGDACLRRALARSPVLTRENAIHPESREAIYPAQALGITQSLPGSSAGGEQPKFLATLRLEDGLRPVIVKFSAPVDQPTGRRWSDLLVAELVAHQTLAEAGLAGTGAELIHADGRSFLEITRFDRTAGGGRRGLVSLQALLAATGNLHLRDWPAAAETLQRLRLIDEDSVRTIRLLHAFGELIGNSDMHAGNLSFFMGNSQPFRLAPAYDMLPMLWAPGPQGEIVPRRFAPAPPLPSLLPIWREAAVLAERFWERLSDDGRLSAEFSGEARSARATFHHLRKHVG